ncbi:uncharacterized protein [Oscarella lobularis]|uniref:uncharacterized protein isoform X2 n=1 Tax=Oscarella lobularis TaxID=121494 RepID=UPI0033139E8E
MFSRWLFVLIISCFGLGVTESACDDYNRYPYNSTSTSLCHGCVSDPCHFCTFCTEGISKSSYCTSDLSQCPLDNQKQEQIDCPRQETIQSSPPSVRNEVNKRQKNGTAHFDCSHNRVYLDLENKAAVDLGISKEILLSDELRLGEDPVPYKLFSNLCGSVQDSQCPLSSSPILAVGKYCIEMGEKESDEVYLNNATEGLSGGFQLNFGQVRCCSNSQAREINVTLEFIDWRLQWDEQLNYYSINCEIVP